MGLNMQMVFKKFMESEMKGNFVLVQKNFGIKTVFLWHIFFTFFFLILSHMKNRTLAPNLQQAAEDQPTAYSNQSRKSNNGPYNS